MNGREYNEGEIVVIEPGEATDFEALQDTITTVIKIPCVKDDKYII
jgi:quercetin dioxygenase-like cupin family protein